MDKMLKAMRTYGEEIVKALSDKYKFDYAEGVASVLGEHEQKRGRPEKTVKKVVNKDKLLAVVADAQAEIGTTEVAEAATATATTEVVEKKKRAPAKKKTVAEAAAVVVETAAVAEAVAVVPVVEEKKKKTAPAKKKAAEAEVAEPVVAEPVVAEPVVAEPVVAEKKKKAAPAKKKTEAVEAEEPVVDAEKKKKAAPAKKTTEVAAEKKKKSVDKAALVEDVITAGLKAVAVSPKAEKKTIGQFAYKEATKAAAVPKVVVPKVVVPEPAELVLEEEEEEEAECEDFEYKGVMYLRSPDNIVYDATQPEEGIVVGRWDGTDIVFEAEED